MTYLVTYLLSSIGLTVVIVWPEDGPGAWFREQLLRRVLPEKARGVLDCYICLSFWSGLLLQPLWWSICGEPWTWAGCLMPPGLLWILLRNPTTDDS